MDTFIKMVATTFLCWILLRNTATGHSIQTFCFPSKLKALLFNAIPHAKELQNKYELEGNKPNCQFMFQLTNHPCCNLRGMERLALSLYRVSLTVQVLENITMDSLVRNNLEIFTVIQDELSRCEATKSPEAEACQQHLMKYVAKVPTECLKNDILFHLIWTLYEDVGFLLPGEHQGDEAQKGSLTFTPKVRSSKKRKRRRKNKGKKTKKVNFLTNI